MRVYKLINHDHTGYMLSKEKVPKILKNNEPPRSITADWYDKKPNYTPDIVRLNGGWPNMAFTDRVKEQLEGSSHATGEWTEVKVNDSILWLFHSTFLVDALDESRSEITRLETGRVLRIRIHAFNPDLVPKDRLFMLKTRPYDLLCSDDFIEKVSDYGWTGFRYKPVWDSNFDPFPAGPYRRELLACPEI